MLDMAAMLHWSHAGAQAQQLVWYNVQQRIIMAACKCAAASCLHTSRCPLTTGGPRKRQKRSAGAGRAAAGGRGKSQASAIALSFVDRFAVSEGLSASGHDLVVPRPSCSLTLY
jgi:hypothetical protein